MNTVLRYSVGRRSAGAMRQRWPSTWSGRHSRSPCCAKCAGSSRVHSTGPSPSCRCPASRSTYTGRPRTSAGRGPSWTASRQSGASREAAAAVPPRAAAATSLCAKSGRPASTTCLSKNTSQSTAATATISESCLPMQLWHGRRGGTRRAAGRKAVQTRQYRKSERQRMAAVRADVAAERAAAAKVRSEENQARLRREAPHLARGAPKIPRQRGRGAAYDSGSDDE